MKRIFIFITLFYCVTAWAQSEYTISGFVKDLASGEALLGVNVLLDTSIGTTTNEYGFYSLSVPDGKYELTISYLGFQTVKRNLKLTTDITLNFEIREDTNELKEVVVIADLDTQTANLRSTEMSVVSLQAATVKKLPAILGEPDILRSIQLLPGVSSVNDAANGFNVRGGSADQNLVLLDEATIYNASHLFGFFSVFNTNAVKEVKLYKGGIPSIYGGRLSSVLDIKQLEGNTKQFKGTAGIGLISGNVFVEGPISKEGNDEGRGSYMVAARRSWIDLFTFASEEFSDTRLFFYDINLKANYKINEKNRLYLSGYFGRDKFEIEEFLGTGWGNASGTLRWTSVLNNKLFLQTSAIFSNYDYNLDNLRSGSEFRWSSSITNFNFKPRLSWFINSNNKIKIGVDATYYNFKPGKIAALNGSSINPETFRDKFALETGTYIDARQNLSDKLSVNYGLRFSTFHRIGKDEINVYENGKPLSFNEQFAEYERNEVIGIKSFGSGKVIEYFNRLEPRFSIRYLLTNESSLKLSYNRMNQFIHLISNTTSATPLDVWAPSGPFLEPQYSDQIAIGYFKGVYNTTYDFNIEAYYKKLSDVTDFIDGADLLFTENIETEVIQGNGRAYGLELQINKNKGRLKGWLSYTLARSEAKIKGINNNNYYPTNSDQTHELNLVGFYKLNDRWDFSSNFVFGSGRPVTYPSGKYEQNGLVVADYSERNGNRLPIYHRLDLSATLQPKPDAKLQGKWIFSLANAYNRLNAASIYFREIGEVNDVEVATGRTEASRLSYFGIVPSITYQIQF